MENIGEHLKNGIAKFSHAQIIDLKRFGDEIIKTDRPIRVNLGKNVHKAKEIKYEDVSWSGAIRKGNFFYWYSRPLQNYYHALYDSLGCLFYYIQVKLTHPNLKLVLNKNHNKIEKWPPFVKEILELLEIPYEYTDEHAVYENVYFGNTLNQDEKGMRVTPEPGYFLVLESLINCALMKELDVPRYDNIYISRRTKHNPNYSRELIGEDNTQKRGCVNEDEIVDILTKQGFVEVFGENYTLAEKITMFSRMTKYVTFSGAGITNTFFRKRGFIGGISSPGLPFPTKERHVIYSPYFDNTISIFNDVSFVDDSSKHYNNPWRINSLDNFNNWARTL